MAKPIIIGLTGLAESGKSSLGAFLERRYGFARLPMAAPLKNMLKAIGLTDAHVSGALKEVPCDLLQGRTPRHAMQTIGTEWGREMIGPEFWLGLWVNSAREWLASGVGVVCDDIRFDTEAEALKAIGGKIVKLERIGTKQMGHASERGITPSLVDLTISNDSTLDDLFQSFEFCLGKLL